MDFVKFYIVQLVKSAASRIRLIDKEKEKLLSHIVARIENSNDLFPDLKTMERVVELEEAATKLISIYKRLNKSHIDLEKISYQFVNDRDAIQSILRRFIQGNYQTGIIRKKRPKIVFDDTTSTIYEIKEPEEVESIEPTSESSQQPKVDLMEFLKIKESNVIALTSGSETHVEEKDLAKETEKNVVESFDEKKTTLEEESLEIENGIAKKSFNKISDESHQKKLDDALVPQLEFKWQNQEKEQDYTEIEEKQDQKSQQKIDENELGEIEKTAENIEADLATSSKESERITESAEFQELPATNLESAENSELKSDSSNSEIAPEETSINEKTDEQKIEEAESSLEPIEESRLELNLDSLKSIGDNLYLEFEKLVYDNILEIDDFLTKILSQSVDDESQLKIINKAYRCFQLSKELNFDFITELIKVYWLALVAIRDLRLKPTRTNTELIRSTLIILVSLLKQRELDLEPFMSKHNKLKEILIKLEYEV